MTLGDQEYTFFSGLRKKFIGKTKNFKHDQEENDYF
jgi:hypothetical protein